MTKPETCGAAGGAVAFWVKINMLGSTGGGIISSYKRGNTGFFIGTSNDGTVG